MVLILFMLIQILKQFYQIDGARNLYHVSQCTKEVGACGDIYGIDIGFNWKLVRHTFSTKQLTDTELSRLENDCLKICQEITVDAKGCEYFTDRFKFDCISHREKVDRGVVFTSQWYCWPLKKCNDTIVIPPTPAPPLVSDGLTLQKGFCSDSNGNRQVANVIHIRKFTQVDPFTDGQLKDLNEDCLRLCRAWSGYTACERFLNINFLHYDCFIHTAEVTKGTGSPGDWHCWAKLQDTTNGLTSTTSKIGAATSTEISSGTPLLSTIALSGPISAISTTTSATTATTVITTTRLTTLKSSKTISIIEKSVTITPSATVTTTMTRATEIKSLVAISSVITKSTIIPITGTSTILPANLGNTKGTSTPTGWYKNKKSNIKKVLQGRNGFFRDRGFQLLCDTIKKLKRINLAACFESCFDLHVCKAYCYNHRTKECSIHAKHYVIGDEVKNDRDFMHFEIY